MSRFLARHVVQKRRLGRIFERELNQLRLSSILERQVAENGRLSGICERHVAQRHARAVILSAKWLQCQKLRCCRVCES